MRSDTAAEPSPDAAASLAPPSELTGPGSPQAARNHSDTETALDGSDGKAPTCEELVAPGSRAQNARTLPSYDYLRVARRENVRGNWDASQRAFCQAAGAPDASVAAWLEFGQLLLARRDSAAALTWTERALAANPTSAAALALSGDALVRTGKVERAKQQWLRAVNVSGTDDAAITRMTRGNLEEGQRAAKQYDFARAERYYRRVLAFEPGNALAAAKLGDALAKLGLPRGAEYWAHRAAELSASPP